MSGEPYLIARDFRIWFGKRRGFVAALRKAEPEHVRAVDGIDLDIAKGEIYCLVGESGCGKTTTGKGILRLVDVTGGDVFVGVPPEVLEEYRAARGRDDSQALEAIRRRWSLSYRERIVWKPREILLFLGFAILGTVAAGIVGGLLGSLLGSWGILAYLPAGVALGFVGTLPWVKATPSVPRFLILFGVLATILGQLVRVGLDPSAYLRQWEADFAGVVGHLAEFLFTMVTALYAAKGFGSYWRSRRGIESDKFRKLRKTLQIIFQDPYESLNPKHCIYDTVAEPLIVNRVTTNREETEARVREALDEAGLRPPEDFLFRYPHELSGGQRQRVSIAGAMVLRPDFVVADEPVSMLDVSIRTEVLETLLELRKNKGLTYLFITHDLSLAWVLADRIGVMYLGKIVEEGPKRDIVKNPRHPYTKALISVVPVPDPDRRHERTILRGERPDPSNIPPGCRFHPRCPVAVETCGWTSEEVADDLREIAAGNGRGPKDLEGMAVDGPGRVVLPIASPETEEWIRAQIAAHAEVHRSLKAVYIVERRGDGLRLVLYVGVEPTLKSVTPDARVACHLAG